MTRKGWLWSLVTITLIAALGGWLWSLEWKQRTLDPRFSEEALDNPYLVAERFLQQWDIALHKERGFSRLDSEGDTEGLPGTDETLLLLNAYGQLSERRTETLLAWINRGGHLVVSAENPFVGESVEASFFDYFGVTVETEGSDIGILSAGEGSTACKALPAPALFDGGRDGVQLELAMPGNRVFHVKEGRELLRISDHLGPRLVQMKAGAGRVTFVASAALWRNAYIGCHDHAFLLWQLVPDQSALRILHNLEGPSLLNLLRERAAVASLSLIAGILLLLWHYGVRFGPIRDNPNDSRRSLIEHVDAAAHFAWRHKRQYPLLHAVRREVEGLAASRIPGYRPLGHAERISALSQHSGLERQRVAQAMATDPADENTFLATMQTLKSLRESL